MGPVTVTRHCRTFTAETARGARRAVLGVTASQALQKL